MPSDAAIRLDVAPGGFALTSEGEDRGAADTLYGSLTTGTCYVAPGGHLACSMLYMLPESPRSTPLRLTGGLDAAGGAGAFLSGADPPLGLEPYVYGSWSAEHDCRPRARRADRELPTRLTSVLSGPYKGDGDESERRRQGGSGAGSDLGVVAIHRSIRTTRALPFCFITYERGA